jgi:two-component system, OmpR family, osmolarity sensor histidine kinase EnvZ
MALTFPKSLVPRSFYGRAVLILIVPIIVIQVVLSVVFIQRHYERVTQQLTQNSLLTLSVALRQLNDADSMADGLALAAEWLGALDVSIRAATHLPYPAGTEPRHWLDLAGREVVDVLRKNLSGYAGADLVSHPSQVLVWVESIHGVVEITMPRRLVSATNPHQLLVIVFLASVLMAGIAFQFLRLQVRPIRRLGEAAEAYGRGQSVPVKSSGAREIRAAALAFVDMRNRIERQNTQRKIMLSGISHDMRTPLTRMRLILSMMEDDDDAAALRTEIADLEQLLNGFLDYSRGQGISVLQQVDPAALLRDLVGRYAAAGAQVAYTPPMITPPKVRVDPSLIERALDNLVSNGVRYGTHVHTSVAVTDGAILWSVEDDGPGIAPRDRARAIEPFVRLDDSRNQDSGSGVGLGLSIVAEAARAHGGIVRLDDSPTLGGLRATLQVPLRDRHNP